MIKIRGDLLWDAGRLRRRIMQFCAEANEEAAAGGKRPRFKKKLRAVCFRNRFADEEPEAEPFLFVRGKRLVEVRQCFGRDDVAVVFNPNFRTLFRRFRPRLDDVDRYAHGCVRFRSRWAY